MKKGLARHRHGFEPSWPLDPSTPAILAVGFSRWGGGVYKQLVGRLPLAPQTLNHSRPPPPRSPLALSGSPLRFRRRGTTPTGDGDPPPSPPLLLALRQLRGSEDAGKSTHLLLLLALRQLRHGRCFLFLIFFFFFLQIR